MTSIKRILPLASALFLLANIAIANDVVVDEACTEQDNCRQTLGKINKINIEIDPVFDERKDDENNWLFRLVNDLKIKTDDATIRRDLLFTEGDSVDHHTIFESERILRSRRYLINTSVNTTKNSDGSSDVNIKTRDVWTTLPYLKYQPGGGSSDWSFGIHESNLLGKGKRVDLIQQQLEERSGTLVIYEDSNTGWHHTRLYARVEDNDDGTYQQLNFERPYFQMNTPNAGGINVVNFEQENIVYDFGKPVGRYRSFADDLELFWGTKLNISDSSHIHRINVGATHIDHEFENVLGFDNNAIPNNWDADTAWIEYQVVQDRYIKASNIRQMSEVEDINLGLQVRMRVGYTASSQDELDKALYSEIAVNKAHMFGGDHVLFTGLSYAGYSTDKGTRGGLASTNLAYHWNNYDNSQLYIGVKTHNMLNGFAENYMLLGGKSGMRGYPAYFQTGSKSYLVNVEQRYFGKKEWFSLFYLGAAVFYDQGRAWGKSLFPQSYDGTLSDVGVGLRISPTRALKSESGSGYVLHFDIATPINGPDGIDSTQLLLKIKHEF